MSRSEESEVETRPSWLVDLGTSAGTGLLAAFVAAGPAALRLSSLDGETRAWLLLAAAATPFTIAAVLVMREAYTGLRAYAGDARGFVRLFVTIWLAISTVAFDVLGAVLRATTHHHALAGVTFALVALTVVFFAGLFAHRTARLLFTLSARASSSLSVAVYAGVALLVLASVRHLHAKLPAESAATMVDVTALILASALAARPELRGSRPLAVVGPLAALAVVGLGLARFSPDLGQRVLHRAPAFGELLSALRAMR